MPASNERALAKGPGLAADAIIVDLEDSVGPAEKASARSRAVHALQHQDYGYRLRALRINAADTPWHADDMTAVVAASPDIVLLPKVDTADDVLAFASVLTELGANPDIAIWLMIETPLAVLNIQSIAAVARNDPRLQALCLGTNDLALTCGLPVPSERSVVLPWFMQVVAAASAYDLLLLDSVYNDFSDLEGLQGECIAARHMGMDGKTLIHPAQIAAANAAFSPSVDEVAHAKTIVAAFAAPANAGKGVVQMGGKMVERLHLEMAEKTLLLADRARLHG